jgi:hypothetical protein
MYSQITTSISDHDRLENAKRIGLSLQEFDILLASANKAYGVIKNLGPFYGNEEINEPTFRITAEPVKLPKGSKELLIHLGNDLLHLGRALKKLPDSVKKKLGEGVDFNIPLTWRIDAIIDNNNEIRVNEIEGQDGANALMVAEQLAYNLQDMYQSTAAKLTFALRVLLGKKTAPIKLAWLRVQNPHTANAKQFIKFMDQVSGETIFLEHIFEDDVRAGKIKNLGEKYDAVLNETSMSPNELEKFGVHKNQLLVAGNYNALPNKGTFALVFDESLNDFWIENIGKERLERLRKILIPTNFVHTEEEIETNRKNKKVVKTSWAGSNTTLINRSRGVAIPNDSIEQGSSERWNLLKDMIHQEFRIIAQDFVEPTRIFAYLRKKGTNLEPVEWYNRICAKYVVMGDPQADPLPEVALSATEVTLGPDIIPAGRKCAFTAGTF